MRADRAPLKLNVKLKKAECGVDTCKSLETEGSELTVVMLLMMIPQLLPILDLLAAIAPVVRRSIESHLPEISQRAIGDADSHSAGGGLADSPDSRQREPSDGVSQSVSWSMSVARSCHHACVCAKERTQAWITN